MAVATKETQTRTWQVDKVHSSVGFEVRHSGVSIFRGSFADFDATLEFVDGEPTLSGSVEVASIQVPDETLTGHLLSPDFFDVERHPRISFSSTDVKRGEDGSITVEGDLSIKGRAHRVTAQGRIDHVDADLAGGERYGVHLETTIDRTNFGVDWNAELPGGGLVLENDVKVIVHLEFTPEA
jgi:polyisoprenoid-binding protein YceI